MLKIRNLSLGYNSSPLISDFALEIEKGEFLGIIGPNGAGKTTLLRGLSGILNAIDGEISLYDKRISRYKRKELAKIIGLVPQKSEITLSFTCFETVLMGRYPYIGFTEKKEDYEIAKRMMKITDTEDLAERKIDEISGGELQRVRIARALTQTPQMLLLDEPTLSLDINHEIQIFDILKELNETGEGLTIIVSSHNLNIAGAYCKRILLLNKGAVVKLGTPDQILTKETIESIYGSKVAIQKNPVTGTPLVISVPSRKKMQNYQF
jgi:iron complex transport system ATP-binding protein